VCYLTRSELSTLGNIETRAAETSAASISLNISERINLEIHDGTVGGMVGSDISSNPNPNSQIAKVIKLLRQTKPEIVFLPYWEERHPDHVETSKLCTRAVFFSGLAKYLPELGSRHTPHQVIYYQMRYEFTPSFIVDITETYNDKRAAITCYASQVTPPKSGPGTLLAQPLSLTAMEARDKYYGAMIGKQYGEPFLVRNTIELDDPVGHFLKHPGREALFYPRNDV